MTCSGSPPYALSRCHGGFLPVNENPLQCVFARTSLGESEMVNFSLRSPSPRGTFFVNPRKKLMKANPGPDGEYTDKEPEPDATTPANEPAADLRRRKVRRPVDVPSDLKT